MEIDSGKAAAFMGRHIGESVEGTLFDMPGYTLKISGGSDNSGFPMDSSVLGAIKTSVLRLKATSGRNKGIYRRMTIRGNARRADTAQVNLTVSAYGDKSIEDIFGPAKEKRQKVEGK